MVKCDVLKRIDNDGKITTPSGMAPITWERRHNGDDLLPHDSGEIIGETTSGTRTDYLSDALGCDPSGVSMIGPTHRVDFPRTHTRTFITCCATGFGPWPNTPPIARKFCTKWSISISIRILSIGGFHIPVCENTSRVEP